MANEIVKKLGMKSDIVFKAFFSREENKKFLEEFISAVLGEKIKIKNVVHDARLEQSSNNNSNIRLLLYRFTGIYIENSESCKWTQRIGDK